MVRWFVASLRCATLIFYDLCGNERNMSVIKRFASRQAHLKTCTNFTLQCLAEVTCSRILYIFTHSTTKTLITLIVIQNPHHKQLILKTFHFQISKPSLTVMKWAAGHNLTRFYYARSCHSKLARKNRNNSRHSGKQANPYFMIDNIKLLLKKTNESEGVTMCAEKKTDSLSVFLLTHF